MINRIIQTAIVVFTLLFGGFVVLVFASDRLYSMSHAARAGKVTAERGIELLDAAMKLTPGDSRLYAAKSTFMALVGQGAGSEERVAKNSTTVIARSRPDKDAATKQSQTQERNNATTQQRNNAPPGDLLYERQLQVIAAAINLNPAIGAYHFSYALTMRKVHPRMTIMATKFLLSEFKKASALRPMNPGYRRVYEKYDTRYGEGK